MGRRGRLALATAALWAGAVGGGCGAGRAAGGGRLGAARELREYVLVIPPRDSLAVSLADLLRRRGFRVRPALRGDGRPAAALVRFTFRDASSESGRWLHVRFFDTRSGALVAAASIPLDTLPDDPRLCARLLVGELLAPASGTPPERR